MVSVEHHSASEGMLPPVEVSKSPISFCSSRDSRPQQQGRVGCPGLNRIHNLVELSLNSIHDHFPHRAVGVSRVHHVSCFSRGQTADLNVRGLVRGPIMILILRFQTFLTGGVEEPFPLKGLLDPSIPSLSSFH